MSQIKIIVKNIRKHGFLFVDDAVDFFRNMGYTFDQTLLVARVREINKNPQKYGFAKGYGIGSRPLEIDGKIRQVYTTVDLGHFKKLDARDPDTRKNVKRFKTA